MSTLARLMGETQRLREGRRVFVSSESVSAYKVANNKKQLLDGDHPLVLSLPADVSDNSRGYGATAATPDLSLLDASVGPELKWTLSSINHVLRTVSKYGEPTYLFANILDTDPQAFVAVTLNKRTPQDELQHLEGVMSRVCNFHVADSKPVQVPGPDQVVSALGKGLMKLVFGGSSSSSKAQLKSDRDRKSSDRSASPPSRHQQYNQQQPGQYGYNPNPSSTKSYEQERDDYLASIDQNRQGAHVATTATAAGGAGGAGAGGRYGSAATVGRRDEEGEDVPTAPVLPNNQHTAMGVGSRAEADARLAALKAEMGGGGEATAPDVYNPHTRADTTSRQQQHHYPSLPSDTSDDTKFDTTPYGSSASGAQQQHAGGGDPAWQAHTAGTLSNPFTTGRGAAGAGAGGGGRSSVYGTDSTSAPPAPHTMSYEDYLQRDEQWGSSNRGSARQQRDDDAGGWEAQGGGSSDSRGGEGNRGGYQYGVGGGYDGGRVYQQRADQGTAAAGSSEREQRRLRYEEEARQAREEWDRAQREQAAARDRRAAAAAAPASPPRAAPAPKSRVRYYGEKDDSDTNTQQDNSYNRGGEQQPAYAYAGAGGAGGYGYGGQQQQHQKKQQAPDWLEVLGKVFAGGPSYVQGAPAL